MNVIHVCDNFNDTHELVIHSLLRHILSGVVCISVCSTCNSTSSEICLYYVNINNHKIVTTKTN